MRWLVRLAAAGLLAWALGFVGFTVFLPKPAPDTLVTDAIVVPTGAPGRIARGAELLAKGRAKRMFISGVDRSAGAASIARVGGLDRQLFATRVDVGHEASNTRANAEETLGWLRAKRATSVRLVTTDWHMARARFELDEIAPNDLKVFNDAVVSNPEFGVLMREYNKYLLRRTAALGGW